MKRNIFLTIFILAIAVSPKVRAGINDRFESAQIPNENRFINKEKKKNALWIEDLVKDLEKNNSNPEVLAKLFDQLGQVYFQRENYSKAVESYMKSIWLREQANKSSTFGINAPWLLIEIGNAFYQTRQYEAALDVYHYALTIFRMRGEKNGMVTSINNIGLVYLRLSDPYNAKKAFDFAGTLSHKMGNIDLEVLNRIYTSKCYAMKGRKDFALSMLKSIDKDFAGKINHENRTFQLEDIAKIYKASGENDSALHYFQRLAAIPDQSAPQMAGVYHNLSEVYFNDNQYDQAIQNGQKALVYVENIDGMEILKSLVSNTLSMSFELKGDYKNALKYARMNNRLENGRNQEKLIQMFTNFESQMNYFSQSVALTFSKEKENQYKVEKSRQQSMTVFLVLMMAILLSSLMFGKGLKTRLLYIREYLTSFGHSQRLLMLGGAIVYFICFFIVFIPFDGVLSDLSGQRYLLSIPGLGAFLVFSLMYNVVYRRFFSGDEQEGFLSKIHINPILLLGIGLLLTMMGEIYILQRISSIHLSANFLISSFLIVFDSFLIPVFAVFIFIDRILIRSIDKETQTVNEGISKIQAIIPEEKKKIVISSKKTNASIEFFQDEFVATEALGNYCMFYLMKDGVLNKQIIHSTMKQVEEVLMDYKTIVRCHKSYIINLSFISKISGNSRGYLLNFDCEIEPVPVSRALQNELIKTIREYMSHA